MTEKLGHFRVVRLQNQLLRLEKRSEVPVVLAALVGVLLTVVWLLRPLQSPSGLVVSLFLVALPLPGIVAVLYTRPWKEVLIFDRAAANLVRKERYLIRRDKVTDLPLGTIEGVNPVQRTVRFVDKKGQLVEHVYWAALLRHTGGDDIELDGANSRERMRELIETINEFLAGSGLSSSRR